MGKELILKSFVRKYQGMSFRWGIRDCNVLAVEWFDVLKGTQYAHVIKGKYDDGESAKAVLEKQGHDVFDFLKRHGAKEVPEKLAADGDFVVFENSEQFTSCGILYNRRVMCPFIDRPVLLIPLAMWHFDSVFLRL